MDIITKAKRSAVMAKIKGRDTKPEIAIRKLLHRMGYRFRLHNKKLPGSPDICLPKYNTAVFVHGCFWHHHKNCRDGKIPKSNQKYWISKIQANVERDIKKRRALKRLGWNIVTIWGCELNNLKHLEKKLKSKIT